jgi:hypothetical protein
MKRALRIFNWIFRRYTTAVILAVVCICLLITSVAFAGQMGGQMSSSATSQNSGDGALVGLAIVKSIPINGFAVMWDTSEYNDSVNGTLPFFIGSSNTKLTVPASGVSRVIVAACIDWAADASGYREMYIRKNGATGVRGMPRITFPVAPSATVPLVQCVTSPILRVSGGDFFEVIAYTSAGPLNVGNTAGAAWFSMHAVKW